MANYKIQVEHARYWRGQPHRWSTNYHFNLAATRAPIDSTACDAFAAAERPILWGGVATQNGISSISIYGPAGGVPIASKTYYDWKTPASWAPGALGGAWVGPPSGLEAAEIAYTFHIPTGLSRSGKPVYLRKWFHCAPSTASGSTADIPAAAQTSLNAAFVTLTNSLSSTYGLIYASPSGSIPGTPTVQPFYGAHQMPRGRKRKALVNASGHYTGPTIDPGPLVAD